MGFCQLWLTCEDAAEADAITQVLLDQKLIACAKQIPVTADFAWKGQKEHNDEILLVMESREELFDQVEAEVAKRHSYETFVLQAIPISRLSKKAETWLSEETNHEQ